jgi:hypothetical protein
VGDSDLQPLSWSCTAAFNTIPAQQLDRNIRTLPSDFAELRLDPVNTLNVALMKNTSIAKTTVQLRAETFNAFDRGVRSGTVLGAGDRADHERRRADHQPRERAPFGAVRCSLDVVRKP